jgi:hypothetical protein
VELVLEAKTVKPPLRCTAKYFHLDSEESLPLNTNIFKHSFQAQAACLTFAEVFPKEAIEI